MANLPTSIKNLNTLLGEQLTDGGGGGVEPVIVAQDIKSQSATDVESFKLLQMVLAQGEETVKLTAIFADVDDISKVHYIVYGGVIRNIETALLSKVTVLSPDRTTPGNYLDEDTEAWLIWLSKSPLATSLSPETYEEAFIFPTSTKVGVSIS